MQERKRYKLEKAAQKKGGKGSSPSAEPASASDTASSAVSIAAVNGSAAPLEANASGREPSAEVLLGGAALQLPASPELQLRAPPAGEQVGDGCVDDTGPSISSVQQEPADRLHDSQDAGPHDQRTTDCEPSEDGELISLQEDLDVLEACRSTALEESDHMQVLQLRCLLLLCPSLVFLSHSA